MRLALTGATGYLGSFVAQAALALPGVSVLSLTRRAHPLFVGRAEFNEAAFAGDWEPALLAFRPDALIHCAALATPGECELQPQLAIESNVLLTERLAAACGRCGAHLVAVSTDLVFDGNTLPPPSGFDESAVPAPRSVYGRSKREGELAAICLPGAAVVRTSLLYGDPIGPKEGALGWMKAAFGAGRPVKLFEDEWRTPLYVRDAAAVLLKCALSRTAGLFHAAGPERLSRVDFGLQFVEIWGVSADLIEVCRRRDVPSVPARPADVSLAAGRAERSFSMRFRTVREALREMHEAR